MPAREMSWRRVASPPGTALRTRHETVAVDHHIDRIHVGLIHGREFGVFRHDDFASADAARGIFLTVFLDSPTSIAKK